MSSQLVIPVAAFDALVNDRGQSTAGAHLTLVDPFAPRAEISEGLLNSLSDLFADVVPFSFQLNEVAVFPEGDAYLAPQPSAPFRTLVHEIARVFPEYAGRGRLSSGRFGDAVPHVSLPLRPGESLLDLEAEVAAQSGTVVLAQQVQLLLCEHRTVTVLAEFPFGTTAA